MSTDNEDRIRPGCWQRKSTRCVYENPWIKVSHDDVITPGNTDGIYGVVHFKNTAIGVVPIDDQGYTFLVNQTRYTLNTDTWEIPEGGCPKGEDPLAAAKRELQEEVGLVARDWEKLLELHLSNSVTDESAIVYTARGLASVDQALEVTEDIQVRKLSLHEAVEMVDRGEITDAISVAALLKLART